VPPGEFPYRKLPGDFRGFFRRNTLWLGPDHLLLVDSTRFSETYKRFYLPDIQTIIIRKTPRFVLPYYWLLLAIGALILLVIGLNPFRGRFFWPAVVLLAAVAFYLYAASMFQSCTCHLITRVSRVELGSLFRLHTARQFVDLLAPRILEVQGQLPEGWVERTTTLAELSTPASRNPDTPVDVLPAGTFSWLTVVVFVLILFDGWLTWLQMRAPGSRSLAVPSVTNMIALAICGTVTIVRLSRQKGGTTLRRLVLAGLSVVAILTYGAMIVQSFDQQFYHRTYDNVYLAPHVQPLAAGEVLADMAVGIPGLFLAFSQLSPPKKPTSLFDDGGAKP
jgi:hypothetical protein